MVFWAIFFLIGIRLDPKPAPSPSSLTPSPDGTQAAAPDYHSYAINVARLIRDRDYAALSDWVSPQDGLYIIPYSTVDFETNLRFTQDDLKGFGGSKTLYIWGVHPGTGKPIEMTAQDFFSSFLGARDFSAPEIIGYNKVVRTGNAVENVSEAFPDAYFVDLFFSSSDSQIPDWASLKLVFRTDEAGGERLIAIIHSANTAQ